MGAASNATIHYLKIETVSQEPGQSGGDRNAFNMRTDEPHSTQDRILAEESSSDLLANHSRKTFRSAIVNLRSRLSECYVYECVLRNKHSGEEKEKEIGKKRWSTREHSVGDWVCRETELRTEGSIAALIVALAPTGAATTIHNSAGISERRRTHDERNRFTELTIHVPQQLLDLVLASTHS